MTHFKGLKRSGLANSLKILPSLKNNGGAGWWSLVPISISSSSGGYCWWLLLVVVFSLRQLLPLPRCSAYL
jgi:hypothetical protein